MPGPRITYIPAQYRVRVEFTRADCLAAESPADLLERAKRILRRERAAGRVAFYRIFKTRFERMWSELRASGLPEATKVAVTVVTGAPPMPGISVTPAREPGALAALTLDAAPEVIAGWRFKLFKLTVGRQLRELGVTAVANPAHLHALWLRAQRGERIAGAALAQMPAPKAGGLYQLQVSPGKDELTLVVFDVRGVLAGRLDGLVAEVEKAAQQLSAAFGAPFKTLSKEIRRELESAGRGPEGFGIDLPFVHLAAIARLGEADLVLQVAPDKMSATVTAHKPLPLATTREAWLGLLAAHGIAPATALADEALALIAAGRTLVGSVVARGRHPRPGAEPVLQAAGAPAAFDARSMRDAQQRRVARRGQVVAAWAFRVPAAPGLTVTGQVVPPPAAVFPAVELGAGVSQQADGRIVATADGVPKVTAGSVALDPALVFEGDVNLASGNVRFAGPATITGSIEAGASVEIRGDLTVLGLIEGGTVTVTGTLTVAGGIVATAAGGVRVGGDLSAAFIENAHVDCGGTVRVAQSISGSQVVAGGEVAAGGIIAGGEVCALAGVRCGQLGRGGTRTVARAGVDGRAERRRAHRAARRAKLEAHLAALGAQKKELDRRSEAQTTKHHRAAKTQIGGALERLPALVARLDAQIKALHAPAQNDAAITVRGTLAAGVVAEICGQRVAMPGEVAAVRLSLDARGHARVEPLVDDGGGEGKKAG